MGFLDNRRVWVFKLPLIGYQPESFAMTKTGNALAVLAKIHLLADIWGPVWIIPGQSGVSHYNVSKGAIRRAEDQGSCEISDAVLCHWQRGEDCGCRQSSTAAPSVGESPFSPNDNLLIKGGLCKNHDCHYTPADFAADRGQEMNVLGTRPATWNVESRSIPFSVTKVVGASMIGTQKLVPHTPVKQQAFDTWTNKPNTANPEFLNQAYGVEISHCTGNARRMAVRELLLTDAIWPILEAQKPGWTQTQWGLEFKAALGSQDPDAVVAFWVGFPERRADVAELVCCVIDNLDTTGCFGDTCEAAYLSHHHRMSVALDGKSNDWSVLLKDSRKMASYVVINKICLEVVDLGSGYSTCQALKAFTVLQTQLTTNGDMNEYVFLEPPSKRFRILNDVDKILTPDSSLKRLLSKSSETIGYEVSNRQNRTCDSQTYIRSSTQSYQRWKVPRRLSMCKEVITNSSSLVRPHESMITSTHLSNPSRMAESAQNRHSGIPGYAHQARSTFGLTSEHCHDNQSESISLRRSSIVLQQASDSYGSSELNGNAIRGPSGAEQDGQIVLGQTPRLRRRPNFGK